VPAAAQEDPVAAPSEEALDEDHQVMFEPEATMSTTNNNIGTPVRGIRGTSLTPQRKSSEDADLANDLKALKITEEHCAAAIMLNTGILGLGTETHPHVIAVNTERSKRLSTLVHACP
jgi:hypothetical protein